MVSCSDWNVAFGSFCFMTARPKVLEPNSSLTFVPSAISGSERIARDVTSRIAQSLPDISDM